MAKALLEEFETHKPLLDSGAVIDYVFARAEFDEESGEPTQPSGTLAPSEAPGPQGAFDTHGWWAEQQQAAREEQAKRHAASGQDDESVATAEEQGW